MNRRMVKTKEYTFHSKKNGCPVTVIGDVARLVAIQLENNEKILSYKVNVPWNCPVLLDYTNGIRKVYFEQSWMSDFLIEYRDGSQMIVEVIKEDRLSKLAEVEKLEMSRRYWKAKGIKWRVAIRKDGGAIFDAILGM